MATVGQGWLIVAKRAGSLGSDERRIPDVRQLLRAASVYAGVMPS
jgi:hypothetical protein